MIHVPAITDDAGHTWRPRVDADLVRAALRDFGLDLHRVARLDVRDAVAAITSDRRSWGAVSYLSVEDQADEAGVSGEAFARLMRGRSGDWSVGGRLTLALVAALARHLPDSRLGRAVAENPAVITEAVTGLLE